MYFQRRASKQWCSACGRQFYCFIWASSRLEVEVVIHLIANYLWRYSLTFRSSSQEAWSDFSSRGKYRDLPSFSFDWLKPVPDFNTTLTIHYMRFPACLVLSWFVAFLRHLFIGWWEVSFNAIVSATELVSFCSLGWPMQPFKITERLSDFSTDRAWLLGTCSPFVGLCLFVKMILCSSTSSVGSSLRFERSSCSVCTGEGIGEERGVGTGVIWTWTT